jgi:hypothetical protein
MIKKTKLQIALKIRCNAFTKVNEFQDRLCGLVVRVLGYRSAARVRFPALPEKKIVGLERVPLSLMSATEELLDRKVAPPV